MKKVSIIDYGCGNLLSVKRAVEHCGAQTNLVSLPSDIKKAECLILPGVGAFRKAMQHLKEKRLVEPIKEYVDSDRPFLGICLGMQLMMESSDEFGFCEGLNLIGGHVKAIPKTGADGSPHKIPHIGWSVIHPGKHQNNCNNSILDGLAGGSSAYFIHSYEAKPDNNKHIVATCQYNGLEITAAIRRGVAFGCQFHPEKSGRTGLRILENFLELQSCEAVSGDFGKVKVV